ncbi:hypothetical protein J437_LFUL002541 [Ladona fulva]|uniref:Uncharacterized protein n=1 Tax=Ladona fulva TaxID=123851 RepID=A0A8K0KU54_LADFU|nr:hypothetical protein J437_LFUL002541 [Ladona fulva]
MYSCDQTSVELLALVEMRKPSSADCHGVARLPPYHCQCNPIELIYVKVKRFVADRNSTFKLSDMETLTHEVKGSVHGLGLRKPEPGDGVRVDPLEIWDAAMCRKCRARKKATTDEDEGGEDPRPSEGWSGKDDQPERINGDSNFDYNTELRDTENDDSEEVDEVDPSNSTVSEEWLP